MPIPLKPGEVVRFDNNQDRRSVITSLEDIEIDLLAGRIEEAQIKVGQLQMQLISSMLERKE